MKNVWGLLVRSKYLYLSSMNRLNFQQTTLHLSSLGLSNLLNAINKQLSNNPTFTFSYLNITANGACTHRFSWCQALHLKIFLYLSLLNLLHKCSCKKKKSENPPKYNADTRALAGTRYLLNMYIIDSNS